MSIYKLFGSATGGSESSVANLDIQFDGVITAMHACMFADFDVDGESATAEASFLSTSTIANNDARGSLLTIQGSNAQAAAGTAVVAINSGVSGVNIPVTAGERVHLHFENTAGVTGQAHFYFYVDDGAATGLRRRR